MAKKDKSTVVSLTIIVILLFFSSTSIVAQTNHYDDFKALKNNPSDTSLLNKLDTVRTLNYRDKYYVLVANLNQNNNDRAKELILNLANIGLYGKDLDLILANQSTIIPAGIKNDLPYQKRLEEIIEETQNRFEKYTIVNMIKHMYNLDQESRKLFKLNKNKSLVYTIDSINLHTIIELFENNQFDTTHQGVKAEEKLYTILLHSCRHINVMKWDVVNSYLLALVNSKKFNPIYYANIVDERLRISGNDEYPKFNFLRRIKVNEEKQNQINMNRKSINAY